MLVNSNYYCCLCGLQEYADRELDLIFNESALLQTIGMIISPPENDSFRKDLCFTHDVFFSSSRDLRDAWADRREILHGGQY